jgi:hypothetical protein
MVVDEETNAEGEANPQSANEDVDMAETDEAFFSVLGTAKSLAILIQQITQLSIESGIKVAQNLFPPAEDTV